ncbi:MAG: hypothetical protein SGCHY_001614, partial [Lobulomycetales sp.]
DEDCEDELADEDCEDELADDDCDDDYEKEEGAAPGVSPVGFGGEAPEEPLPAPQQQQQSDGSRLLASSTTTLATLAIALSLLA